MDHNVKRHIIRISPRDLDIMHQCKMSINEIVNLRTKNAAIPPLWTILGYVLLRNIHDTGAYLWQEYRETLLLSKYRDQHYDSLFLPKRSGGARSINVPDWELRKHQRFIKLHILDFLPVSNYAYAYRKCISMIDCAVPHINQKTVIHLDIKGFFNSITEDMVFRCLERDTGYSKQLVNFISRLCCYKGHLPQGTCTSPILSNICFRECDDKLLAYAQCHHLTYSRYADDLFFSGDIDDADAVIQTVADILKTFGFTLNGEKTKILRRNMSQQVLGIVVNEKLQVSRSYRKALRQEVYYLKKYGDNTKAAKTAPDYLHYLHQLQGKIGYVLYIDPYNKEFQKAKTEVCSLISNIENQHYQNWLDQGNYDSFEEWKLYTYHPHIYYK